MGLSGCQLELCVAISFRANRSATIKVGLTVDEIIIRYREKRRFPKQASHNLQIRGMVIVGLGKVSTAVLSKTCAYN